MIRDGSGEGAGEVDGLAEGKGDVGLALGDGEGAGEFVGCNDGPSGEVGN